MQAIRSRTARRALSAVVGALLAVPIVLTSPADATPAASRTYTTAADFAEGTFNNVVIEGDSITLDDTTTAFPFMWVALSARGTIARIDTLTGQVKGEYSTTSDSDSAHNPSRTTVGLDGSVWAGNRDQSSVIHVGLVEANQCVDRNGNGVIDTSTGYGNVLAWPGGSFQNSSAVSNARDECILHYVNTAGIGGGDARHVSVDAAGDIWVGNWTGTAAGAPGGKPHRFEKIDHTTGLVVPGSAKYSACGGYGGLVDGNGVIWSASHGTLFRWDPALPDSATNPRCIAMGAPGNGGVAVYGLAFDSANNVWATTLNGSQRVHKVSAAGTWLASYFTGLSNSQGLAIDGNDHVWISSSLFGGTNSIAHLRPDGSFVGHVTTCVTGVQPTCRGNGSTGVAVDADGKIWTANINSSDATRIDPNAGPLAADGVTRIGAFDLRTPLPGASPYNYSDMTGATLTGAPESGSWTVVYDSNLVGATWGTISWTADLNGGALGVAAASSTDGTTFGPAQAVTDGADLTVADGRYLKVVVLFNRAVDEQSPVLHDITISTANLNDRPVAEAGGPYVVAEGGSVTVDGSGSSDPDGDTLAFTWDLDNDGVYETDGSTASFSAAGLDGPTTRTVGLQVCDTSNECSTDTADVEITNVLPTVSAAGGSILEGDTFVGSGSFTDPGADAWTATVDYGDGSGPQPLTLNPDKTFSLQHTYVDDDPTGTPADSYTVTITVGDGDGTGSAVPTVLVANVDPTLGTITFPTAPVALGNPITVGASLGDAGADDTHTAVWTWDDGTTSTESASLAGGASASHTYAAAGIYTVSVTVTDDDTGTASTTANGYIVVYDPTGGFVTGGGHIDSPAGAYAADPSLTGRASFGFVSKYHKGASTPSGKTEFQFRAGSFNFHSASYEWLVISGARAQYKGEGTVNGSGSYRFLVTAVDGQVSGGGGTDAFRIKIWDSSTGGMVYDNQLGASEDSGAATALTGGSVVIHK